jgi:DNA-binding Xre family transcriptional regulator|tara:strand:- start:91 stop:426 length:336 start_codon:yes stop_codon:yes gene_type:complete
MSGQNYGIKITTMINAADKLADDLDYLCSLIEQPDVEFPITDAVVYARAVIALAAQLEYISEDLSENELNDEEDCVTLSQAEVMTLHSHTEGSEVALKILEEVCGISLQSN